MVQNKFMLILGSCLFGLSLGLIMPDEIGPGFGLVAGLGFGLVVSSLGKGKKK